MATHKTETAPWTDYEGKHYSPAGPATPIEHEWAPGALAQQRVELHERARSSHYLTVDAVLDLALDLDRLRIALDALARQVAMVEGAFLFDELMAREVVDIR